MSDNGNIGKIEALVLEIARQNISLGQRIDAVNQQSAQQNIALGQRIDAVNQHVVSLASKTHSLPVAYNPGITLLADRQTGRKSAGGYNRSRGKDMAKLKIRRYRARQKIGKSTSFCTVNDRNYLSMRRAAKELGCSYNTIFYRVKHGTIDFTLINNHPFIDEFIVAHERAKQGDRVSLFRLQGEHNGCKTEVKGITSDWVLKMMNQMKVGTFTVEDWKTEPLDPLWEEYLISSGFNVHVWRYGKNKMKISASWPAGMWADRPVIWPAEINKATWENLKTGFLAGKHKEAIEKAFGFAFVPPLPDVKDDDIDRAFDDVGQE